MNKIELTEELLTNNPTIDTDHQQIINIYNNLIDISKNDFDPELFVNVLTDMSKYALHHFKHEELFMESFSYPSFKEHKGLHTAFLKKVSMYNLIYFKDHSVSVFEVLEYLQNWWINHIKIEDQKYMEYQKEL